MSYKEDNKDFNSNNCIYLESIFEDFATMIYDKKINNILLKTKGMIKWKIGKKLN